MTAGFPSSKTDPFKSQLKKAYQGLDGYVLSGMGRNALSATEKEALTYGELPISTFLELMERCHPLKGESFIDLGAGLGQLVLAAAHYYAFAKVAGVECLPQLHEGAKSAKAKITCELKTPQIEFHLGDIRDVRVEEFDILLAHATCYSDVTLRYLAARLKGMKKTARMIVLGQELPESEHYLQETFSYKTQWHRHGTAYLYTRP